MPPPKKKICRNTDAVSSSVREFSNGIAAMATGSSGGGVASQSTKVQEQTGNIGTVLRDLFPFILDEDLIGSVPSPSSSSRTTIANKSKTTHNRRAYNNLQTIVGFLRSHQLQASANDAAAATMAATSVSLDDNDDDDDDDNNNNNSSHDNENCTNETNNSTTSTEAVAVVTSVEYYEPALKEFQRSQLERQAAGLRTNTNRTASVKEMNQLIQNHRNALTLALMTTTTDTNTDTNTNTNSATIFDLSKSRICKIHGAMMIENTSVTDEDEFTSKSKNSRSSSTNQTQIPSYPVETYTQYYHGWTKRVKELSSSHHGNNNHEIENNRQWAKYYAEESSRAAHHFHQHPQATSAPFTLPPAPPRNSKDASESKNSNSSINSSSYRTKPVRASNTHFCPPNRINDEMECVFQQMEMYAEARWRSGAAAAAATNNTVYFYNAISMAAIWMYAIANVHPFRDGNGRLSRIICNYVLKRLLKMPFVITLVATPQQRKEFIESMKFGQIMIRQLSSSSATTAISGFDSDNMFDIDTPIFLKLIDTILDRLSHAIHQFQALLREKSSAAEAQREAKIIRKYRVRAANGQCIICLDDKPNIATLCCGQAVHLNCIAEWLSNQQSCVSCRSPLPRLVGVTNNNNNSNNADYEENQEEEEDSIENINDDTTYDSDTTSDVQQVVDTSDYDTSNDITEDTTEETTDDPAPLPTQDQHQPSRCNICNNMSATNCSNGLCGRCCVNHGAFNCNRHHVAQEQQSDTTDDEDTNTAEGTIDDTTENTTCSDDSVPAPVPVQQQQQSSRCNVCNNRSAMNCSNGLCGRCCVNLGVIYCDRHHASL